jgi:acetate kinase
MKRAFGVAGHASHRRAVRGRKAGNSMSEDRVGREQPGFDVAGFLQADVPVFADFSAEELRALVEASRLVAFEPKEALVVRGEPPTYFGVLVSGTASASIVGDDGSRSELGQLEHGTTFGEMALMTGDSAPADLIADTHCKVLRIPVSVFQSTIVANPAAVKQLSRNLADRLKRLFADPAAAASHDTDPYGLELTSERPVRILVVNAGSSSLKYSFFDTAHPDGRASGQVERIGLDGTAHKFEGPRGKVEERLGEAGFEEALAAMVRALTSNEHGVIARAGDVGVVAHRIVHGGPDFTESTLIEGDVLERIEKLSPLAPLHNPAGVAGVRAMQKLFPAIPHVAVFDTAFHHTMPVSAQLYGLPYEYFEEKHVRRYGFHGTSHSYVALRAAEFLAKKPAELELVSCHLGNGSSLCAIDHGRSVDTTMGFTPGEGLIMGTRCGDLDAGVVTYLERSEGLSAAEIETLLTKKSGLLGLSGVSSDMREVLAAAGRDHQRALVALKAYCYRIRKGIGACVAAMGRVDTVVFTGGIGQGSDIVRALSLQGLECMGIRLDPARNREADGFGGVCVISTDDSKVRVLIVPTDEERMMAREALRTLTRSWVGRVLAAQQQESFLVEVSAHHLHLTQEHVEQLFGRGHQLQWHADLSQPGQFACKEQVNLIGPKGRIDRVRVLGPVRPASQVEIAMTEQFKLGVHPPVRESGDVADTPGCTLEGPAGRVELASGVICALRHIHMTPADALRYGVRDKSFVRVRIAGDRELVFGDVLVRVHPSFSLAMHIDTDEGNAAGVRTGDRGFIDGIQEVR